MAPRCPPSDHIPRQICQPHELLRAQLTHPEPPDVDDAVPSFPASSACTGRPAGVFQGVLNPIRTTTILPSPRVRRVMYLRMVLGM